MVDYVTDTHTLYWYLIASPKLNVDSKAVFDEARAGTALIHISTIVLAELFYLNVKHSYPIDFEAEYQKFEAGSQFVLTPFDPEDVLDFGRDSSVKEMHDRIIVGLARRLDAPLLTSDNNIIASGLVKIV